MKSSATWVRFLTGAGIGAVLLAVAAACGPEEPTPTAAPPPTAAFREVSDPPPGSPAAIQQPIKEKARPN